MKIVTWIVCALGTLVLTPSGPVAASAGTRLQFTAANGGEFSFETGVLRGTLRPSGRSLGLMSVVYLPTGQRLDASNGLLSHYRVFTRGMRYGGGAWDWPSLGSLRNDGAVEVFWPANADRPFQMRAVYRWSAANVLDLETSVTSTQNLAGFESFLANYLTPSFTNAMVFAAHPASQDGGPGLLSIRQAAGVWQMFPREESVLPLIHDGRWLLEPNPVAWTIRPCLEFPLGCRRDPVTGLTVVLMSRPADCFAVASPHETENHYSMYFSLFGKDLVAGETAVAKSRLVVTVAPSEAQLRSLYTEFLRLR